MRYLCVRLYLSIRVSEKNPHGAAILIIVHGSADSQVEHGVRIDIARQGHGKAKEITIVKLSFEAALTTRDLGESLD